VTSTGVRESLEQFLDNYQKQHLSCFEHFPQVDFDPHWRSSCETGNPDSENRISWCSAQQSNTSFSGLERALEVNLHPDIKSYYSNLWFPSVGATSPDGDLELIGIWNPDDFENLQANIIGHAMQLQKRNLPFTIFFATTYPESEYCLAVDNLSGEVVLERAGSKAERVISPNLKEFLDTLTPRFSSTPSVAQDEFKLR
jgi:SecY interacting protein Syd